MSNNSFIRKYWKQIDLHSHTLRGIDCTGKSDSGNYNHKCFLENLKKFGTQLQAITNHNTLYLEDHIKHAIICSMVGVSYIPGVEIDVKLKDSSKPFHCVFLLGPSNDICEFSRRLNSKTQQKQISHQVYFDEEELSDIFAEMHFIYVVHAVKTKGLAESQESADSDKYNINWVCNAIKNALAEPILFENTKPKHVHSFANRFKEFTEREDVLKIVSQQVTTSDYHFDNDMERYNAWVNREKYAICAEPTFEGLELSIRHYENRFQLVEQIVEPPTFVENIRFIKQDNKKLRVSGEIECSPYFNVIIGNSGSGKTLLLNEIYRSINNNYGNLNAVLTEDSKSKYESDSVYSDYIGKNKNLLESVFYKRIKPVAVEIDKIYKKMLDAHNPIEIARLFNISLPNVVNLVFQNYKTRIIEYENLLSFSDNYLKRGEEALNSIRSNTTFINSNDSDNKVLLLSRVLFDETNLNKYTSLYNQTNKIIEGKSFIDNWLKDASKIIPENINEINTLNNAFKTIIEFLNIKRKLFKRSVAKERFNKRFIEIYNTSADSINKVIGSKQVAVDRAKSTVREQTIILRDSIKNVIKNNLLFSTFDLRYPFEKIEQASKENQSNKYARISVNYSDHDKKLCSRNLDLQKIIYTNSNILKIKSALGNREFDLKLDSDVKSVIDNLRAKGVVFSSVLNETIPFVTELFDNQEWKSIQNINPGNLAKDYMTYYFNNVLETIRPNVVFVDQPENDVDKSFISTVLAHFISNSKMGVQFFITSHEPILGVNADSNLIIEAFRFDDGPIGYRSKSFESKSIGSEESGKEIAARILDGGKTNVIKRNQIYGGSIDD